MAQSYQAYSELFRIRSSGHDRRQEDEKSEINCYIGQEKVPDHSSDKNITDHTYTTNLRATYFLQCHLKIKNAVQLMNKESNQGTVRTQQRSSILPCKHQK